MNPAAGAQKARCLRSWAAAVVLAAFAGSLPAATTDFAAAGQPAAAGAKDRAPTRDGSSVVAPATSQTHRATGRSNGLRYIGRASDATGTDGFCAVVEFQSQHYLLVAGSEFRGFRVESFDGHALKLRHVASGRPFTLPITSATQVQSAGTTSAAVHVPAGAQDNRPNRSQHGTQGLASVPDTPPQQDRDIDRPAQPAFMTIRSAEPARLGDSTPPHAGPEFHAEDIATLNAVTVPPSGSETMALLPPSEDHARTNAGAFPSIVSPMELLPPADVSATSGDMAWDNTPPPGGIQPQ